MELQKLFYSPIAWLILIIFSIQSGIALMDMISNYVRSASLGYNNSNITFNIFSGPYGVFSSILRNLYLYIPLLTMGLLSREFGSGSIKLLYSSPISNLQIVLGKFVSMMIVGLAMVLIIFTEVLLGVPAVKDFDLPLVLTGILGIYLVICTYAAIGLFMSSLTTYQIVAAIGTFATLFVLGQVKDVWQDVEFVRDITYWLSISGRSGTLINGLICSEDLLYFILVTGLFIAFTLFRLKGLREKSPSYISFARYLGAFSIVAAIGYVSTLPSLMAYYDSSRTKMNTLTENSQEVISKLKGKIELTTYVNIFDRFYSFGAPIAQKRDMDRYKQYSRFYPNMEFSYKYYYALPIDERSLKSHQSRYEGLTEEQTLEKVCDIYDVNTNKFKPATAYAEEIDLKVELNRMVTTIKTEDGKKINLRLFDDQMVYPDESQITAAFKNLVADLPVVGFVKGHGERDVNDYGSRGYFTITEQKPFRYALKNNGFDFKECELYVPVPKNINILVIADVKTSFSDKELQNLTNYINRGGNLIIACDLKRQENMNPLVDQFGVTFMDGQIVEHNKNYTLDLVTAQPTKSAKELMYHFSQLSDRGGVVSMNGVVGISYKEKKGYSYTPILTSDVVEQQKALDSLGSWNELQTTDFIDDVPQYNPETGETLGALTTALAVTRQVNGKEQKIMILGDADCLSNGELMQQRTGFFAMNYSMVAGMFYWLSDNEVPIDVRRPTPPDDKIYLNKDDVGILKILYKVIIPSLLALCFLFIWLRRKGR
ncbi:Gldg family protein [Flavivirga sp. 57AJ16]|uniref:Gldg family protein n=1 Tax=Flavivirga sp. 57AJ16 TaxID=3025307 RepID=UPI0023662302|nr:Gldg family protein [Flavivirga sp. 57AJ16]MDD7885095.1 Gldg family protein [Flavivirga sp. 57AJ16]